MSTSVDACCPLLYSRGPRSPCLEPVYVGNATDCTEEAYPEGFQCCIDKVGGIRVIVERGVAANIKRARRATCLKRNGVGGVRLAASGRWVSRMME